MSLRQAFFTGLERKARHLHGEYLGLRTYTSLSVQLWLLTLMHGMRAGILQQFFLTFSFVPVFSCI